jgi:hypothetical protein
VSGVTGVFPLLPRMRLYRSGHGKAVLFCTAAQERVHNRNNPRLRAFKRMPHIRNGRQSRFHIRREADMEAPSADFDDVFSAKAIEPLVLLLVVVLGRTGSTAPLRL